MSVINIRSDIKDKFYRYKMPKLLSKIEGKGNGIKTVIPNMTDIAKSLSRPPMYPTKFFGCELGAQVQCDAVNDRYIVNGAHDAEKLQNLLDGFINKFVLCPSCKNPETDLIITKDENITRDCKACGANMPVDLRHKLCTFIIKNPPVTKKSKSSKKSSKKDKAAGNLPTPETASNESDPEDEGIIGAHGIDVNSFPDAHDTADDDWAEDTSAEAVAARMADLATGAVKKLTEGDDEENGVEDSLEAFADFVTTHSGDDKDIIEKAESLSLRDDKVCVVLAQIIFSVDILKENQVKKRAPLLRKFLKNEKCQKGLLGGLERFLGLEPNKSTMLAKTPLVLKAFYDEDLLDEEVVLAWGDKVSKKFVDKKTAAEIREKAGPFLNWLKEADEESEEEDDE
ncbi:hypothetical protein HDV05_000039 [Chytridiales sp. JEL 0842]|nr:hypothetical protein HDV05_000039 [Chytridiales sp. JEL 0842]